MIDIAWFGKRKDVYPEQYLSFLSTYKFVEGTETALHHKIVNMKDRAGLWKVNYNNLIFLWLHNHTSFQQLTIESLHILMYMRLSWFFYKILWY